MIFAIIFVISNKVGAAMSNLSNSVDFIKEIEGILQSLYLMADFNCEGKVQEITLRATITAYEAFIYEKKKDENE